MRAAARGWTEAFVVLVTSAGKLWWATAAKLVMILTVSYAASRILQLAASAVGIMVPSVRVDVDDNLTVSRETIAVWNQWLAIVLTSISLLVLLVGLILSLRALGDHLGRRSDGFAALPQRPPLAHVLSLSLLAFLGIYSVFDEVGNIMNQIVSDALALAFDYNNVLFAPLNPNTWDQALLVLGVLLAAFFLRRIAEGRADKTGNRVLGVISTILEAFYLFAFFVVGRGLIQQLRWWWVQREAAAWVEDALIWLGTPLRWLKLSLPEALSSAWAWFWEVGWPVVVSSFLQPLLWLALGTLVLGSGIKSFSDLLETGDLRTSVSRRLPTARRAVKATETLEQHRTTARRVQSVAFGNIDDKYLPIWHSLRLVLRSGVGLLGAFVVLYALVTLGEAWLDFGLTAVRGPLSFGDSQFVGNFQGLFVYVLSMSVKLCLITAVYVIAFRSEPAPAPDQADAKEAEMDDAEASKTEAEVAA